MAIGGFSINISANKPVTKMQREIKDIKEKKMGVVQNAIRNAISVKII